MNKQTGQTLIEVLIALTIGVLVVGALAIATIVSIRNTQFSQNQTQATKLGQEAVDVVKTIRDRNEAGKVNSASTPVLSSFADLWDHELGSGASARGYFRINVSTLSLNRYDDAASAQGTTPINNLFYRYVLIEDSPSSWAIQKTVTAKVSWTDTSGSHESNIQTILTKQ